ncbi:MBL fold metallo-hydrolase [Actinopolymorpha sp. NPDC004070]|uniref:MBL fold metallo-hydrolase n=1 Tax=Actinopolymorpha sp. NPDC004070 TaxID=3154548 RepID=UPI0033AAC42B
MRLTKLGHACVRLEKDGATLVVDPGTWSGPEALDGADAVLVTHEHFDHVDVDGVRAALRANPHLRVWTHAGVAAQLGAGSDEDGGERVRVVRAGDRFECAGFEVSVHGAEHALLHKEIPVVPNVGFLVDHEVFHPGDSFTVPDERVRTLLLPVDAPWLKASELIDYARAVAPERAYAIHDAMVNEKGAMVVDNWLGVAARPLDATFTRLQPGTGVDL